MRKKILAIIMIIVCTVILGACGSNTNKPSSTATSSNNTQATEKQRQVVGTAVDLGTGSFQGGKDVQVGLYDVTPADGQGNFNIKNGSKLKVNEILGVSQGIGVAKVRVKIESGDEIKLQSINKAHFEPVTAAFVKTYGNISLYCGAWVVGEDIAAGRYKASAPTGSGNFVVYNGSMPVTNEILGSEIGVKEVTVNLKEGNIIHISSLDQVLFTPAE